MGKQKRKQVQSHNKTPDVAYQPHVFAEVSNYITMDNFSHNFEIQFQK